MAGACLGAALHFLESRVRPEVRHSIQDCVGNLLRMRQHDDMAGGDGFDSCVDLRRHRPLQGRSNDLIVNWHP